MILRTVSPFFPLLLLVSATFAEPPNQQRQVPLSESLLLVKADEFAVHLFRGGVIMPPPDKDSVENGMAFGGYTLSHTSLKSAKMKWMYSSGIQSVPTRRISFVYSRILGIAHDDLRLYLTVWESVGFFMTDDNKMPRSGSDALKYAVDQTDGGAFRLLTFSLQDSDLIHRADFQPTVTPKDRSDMATEYTA